MAIASRLKNQIENYFGAPVKLAKRSGTKLGYDVYFQNGRSCFLDEYTFEEAFGRYSSPVVHFPWYQVDCVAHQDLSKVQNYSVFNHIEPQLPKIVNKITPKKDSLRKLYWERYKKTGIKPI